MEVSTITIQSMRSLLPHHITDLFCWIDEMLPPSIPNSNGGRPASLAPSEVVTMLVWNALVIRQKTLKELHTFIGMYHRHDFPRLPKYSTFIAHCHRALPSCIVLLQELLVDTEPIRIMDATMLPVCKLQRADHHKVARMLADFGKNHQGWHYGFKLHASIDRFGKLSAVVFTPANIHDAQVMPKLVNRHAKVAVGDTLYGARVMREIIYAHWGTIIIAPPHPKQRRKIAAPWQIELLNLRPKIESVFDYLKEHLHLVTSFARSITGYFVHYVRILLGYQIMALAQVN